MPDSKSTTARTHQSFVVKSAGRPVGQLTIFYTGDDCTGGQIHLNQGTVAEEKYQVHLKPSQTTYKPRSAAPE